MKRYYDALHVVIGVLGLLLCATFLLFFLYTLAHMGVDGIHAFTDARDVRDYLFAGFETLTGFGGALFLVVYLLYRSYMALF